MRILDVSEFLCKIWTKPPEGFSIPQNFCPFAMPPFSLPFSKPQNIESSHTLILRGHEISYQLLRSPRRTISIRIHHQGVFVRAPLHAGLRPIENLLRQHESWLFEKLAAQKNIIPPPPLGHGSVIPYLGGTLVILLSPGFKKSRWKEAGAFPDKTSPALELAVPLEKTPEEVLRGVLKSRARPLFRERLDHYAALLGFCPPPLFLSSASSRWGSCNHKGEIRLSWRLVHIELSLIDYVVAHELAHLKEMNHSPRFWAIVEKIYPDWRYARSEIRRQKLPPL